MASPRFSVLVPTRDRAATLQHTLATVAAQNGDDYEIVVADNAGGADTQAVLRRFASPKLHHVRSDEILPMAENWEKGLAACSGEYITVLGDDDGLVPTSLEGMRRILAATPAEIVSWSPHTYWWPDTIVHWNRNMVIVELGNQAVVAPSRPTLEEFYRGDRSFGQIPMIYSAFFHRSVVEEAQRRYDGFFVPRDAAPDIASGILGLHITESFVHSTRALSIRGNSGKSNGTAQWARSLGAKQREIYFREERTNLQRMMHPALVPSPNLHIVIANAKLRCRECYFPSDAALDVNLEVVLHEMVNSLNFEPEAYEENLADVRAFAAKLGVKLDAEKIPPMQPFTRHRYWGPGTNPDGSLRHLAINGDLAGVHHVEDAAKLFESIVPPVETFLA